MELKRATDSVTIEDVAREVYAIHRVTKFVGWIAGILLLSILGLGSYMVQTVIENNIRLGQLESSFHSHEQLPNHPAQAGQFNDILIRIALIDQRLSRIEAQQVKSVR